MKAEMTDTVLKIEAMKCLIDKFGMVDAERFIYLLLKEPFDYTIWHRSLFEGMSVRELSEAAQKFCDENKK
ncbi:MAG: hypothetical protein LBQ97_04650 [Fusobacteriaceae bacterium]|jgi:hypothetical protein|nr:hypothetical protein [Fusobacteriaceae bacterium]